MGWVALRQGNYAKAASLFIESLKFKVEIGDKTTIGWNLEGLAATAAAQGDKERAARLLGASSGVHQKFNIPLPVELVSDHALTIEQVQTALGDIMFVTVWQEGQTMPLEQVIDFRP